MNETAAGYETASGDPHEPEQPLRRFQFSDGHLGWFTTKYSSCRQIMGDPRFVHHPLRPLAGEDAGFQDALSGPESLGDLLRLDPPQHTRLRQLQTRYFTVRQVEAKRASFVRIVNGLLNAMEETGPPVDLVRMFALPFPLMALCELLGVPDSGRERFEKPTIVLADVYGTTAEEKKIAVQEFYEFAWDLIREKRKRPGVDPLSDLISAGELTDTELKGVVFILLLAGYHTTATQLAGSVFFLLSRPGRWESARAAPINQTVEELLRYLMVVNTDMPRTATEDIEIDGVMIKAGETVAVVPGRPSGDVAACPTLLEFDPSSDVRGAHLAFGHGRHMCLGQHFARLELQVGLEALMKRFPALRMAAPPDELGWYRPGRTGFNCDVKITNDPLPVAW